MMPGFRRAVLYRIAVLEEIRRREEISVTFGRFRRNAGAGAKPGSLEGASPVQLAGVAFSYLRWLAASVSSAILRLK